MTRGAGAVRITIQNVELDDLDHVAMLRAEYRDVVIAASIAATSSPNGTSTVWIVAS